MPLSVNRTMPGWKMLWNDVNAPPNRFVAIRPRTLPAIEKTDPSAAEPDWKLTSKVPSFPTRAMRLRTTPLTLPNAPPIRMRPSVCTWTADKRPRPRQSDR